MQCASQLWYLTSSLSVRSISARISITFSEFLSLTSCSVSSDDVEIFNDEITGSPSSLTWDDTPCWMSTPLSLLHVWWTISVRELGMSKYGLLLKRARCNSGWSLTQSRMNSFVNCSFLLSHVSTVLKLIAVCYTWFILPHPTLNLFIWKPDNEWLWKMHSLFCCVPEDIWMNRGHSPKHPYNEPRLYFEVVSYQHQKSGINT